MNGFANVYIFKAQKTIQLHLHHTVVWSLVHIFISFICAPAIMEIFMLSSMGKHVLSLNAPNSRHQKSSLSKASSFIEYNRLPFEVLLSLHRLFNFSLTFSWSRWLMLSMAVSRSLSCKFPALNGVHMVGSSLSGCLLLWSTKKRRFQISLASPILLNLSLVCHLTDSYQHCRWSFSNSCNVA